MTLWPRANPGPVGVWPCGTEAGRGYSQRHQRPTRGGTCVLKSSTFDDSLETTTRQPSCTAARRPSSSNCRRPPGRPVTELLLVASRLCRRRWRCHGRASSAIACAPPGLPPVHDSLGTPERRRSRAGSAPRFCTSSNKTGMPLHRGTTQTTRPLSGVQSVAMRVCARSDRCAALG